MLGYLDGDGSALEFDCIGLFNVLPDCVPILLELPVVDTKTEFDGLIDGHPLAAAAQLPLEVSLPIA